MGVKNLNILFSNYNNHNAIPKEFNYVVIDGNNMIISFLSSSVKDIPEDYDITKQTHYILKQCYIMIVTELNKFVEKYNVKEIWFVLDPNKKICYNIDAEFFDLIDEEIFKENIKEDSTKFKLTAKDEEHEKRNKQKNSSVIEFDDDDRREIYGYKNITLLHKLLRTIQKSLINLSRFSLKANSDDEEPDYLNKLIKLKDTVSFYVAQSYNNEADFVIKNLCEDFYNLHKDKNVLVISKDTDYKILLSDLPTVYISDLRVRSSDTIVNPLSMWLKFFEPLGLTEDEIYYYVIRLAPLFGNDYTTGTAPIININKDVKNMNLCVLKLFSPNINAKIPKISSFGKFINKYDYTKSLEENIKNYNTKFYNHYIRSVLLYTNYRYFRDFWIMTNKNNFDNNLKFIYENILLKNLKTINSVKDVNDFVNKFYNIDKQEVEDMEDYFA